VHVRRAFNARSLQRRTSVQCAHSAALLLCSTFSVLHHTNCTLHTAQCLCGASASRKRTRRRQNWRPNDNNNWPIFFCTTTPVRPAPTHNAHHAYHAQNAHTAPAVQRSLAAGCAPLLFLCRVNGPKSIGRPHCDTHIQLPPPHLSQPSHSVAILLPSCSLLVCFFSSLATGARVQQFAGHANAPHLMRHTELGAPNAPGSCQRPIAFDCDYANANQKEKERHQIDEERPSRAAPNLF